MMYEGLASGTEVDERSSHSWKVFVMEDGVRVLVSEANVSL